MRTGLLIWLVCFALTWISFMLPPMSMRWAEGWLIPHAIPRDKCWVKCGTCVPVSKDG